MEVKELVNHLLKEYEGGEKFFDELDANLRKTEYMELFLKFIASKLTKYHPCYIVLSGRFGLHFNNYIQRHWQKIVGHACPLVYVVEGGLRVGEQIASLGCNLTSLPMGSAADFIFIDDSYYSGSTRERVMEALEQRYCSLRETFVVYDGSKSKHGAVTSMYRYWDERA